MSKTINVNDGSVTLATSNTKISEAKYGGKSKRVVLILTNTSTAGETVSISFDKEAKANQGLVIKAGGVYSASIDSRYDIPQGRVNGIGSAATATLAFHEEIEQEE